jgi:hypothetical protein
VVVLGQRAFDAEYHKAFKKVRLRNETEREKFRGTVFEIQGAIVEALKSKWTEKDDFEVGWDFDYYRYVCGGIYSEAIFCVEYVQTVVAALASVDRQGKWTYHTVCEILVNPAAKAMGEAIDDRSEFFVRGNTCYINTKMKAAHRKRLGAPMKTIR